MENLSINFLVFLFVKNLATLKLLKEFSKHKLGIVVQWLEHRPVKPEVAGSSPVNLVVLLTGIIHRLTKLY